MSTHVALRKSSEGSAKTVTIGEASEGHLKVNRMSIHDAMPKPVEGAPKVSCAIDFQGLGRRGDVHQNSRMVKGEIVKMSIYLKMYQITSKYTENITVKEVIM